MGAGRWGWAGARHPCPSVPRREKSLHVMHRLGNAAVSANDKRPQPLLKQGIEALLMAGCGSVQLPIPTFTTSHCLKWSNRRLDRFEAYSSSSKSVNDWSNIAVVTSSRTTSISADAPALNDPRNETYAPKVSTREAFVVICLKAV